MDQWFCMIGPPGRDLDFAVERVSDGNFYFPTSSQWGKPADRSAYSRMIETEPAGSYCASLRNLAPGTEYCIHVVDVETRQCVNRWLGKDVSGNVSVFHEDTRERKTAVGPATGGDPIEDPYFFVNACYGSYKLPLQAQIAIIYDTSFLMNDCRIDVSLSLPTDIPKEDRDRTFSIVQMVPREVKEEIHRHFRDQAKEGKAKRARAIVASLIGDDGNDFRLQEVELRSSTQPLVPGDILGADSLVDRLILGYAVELLENQRFVAVFIATADGGIKLDAARLRKLEGRRIFVIKDLKPSSDLKSILHEVTEGTRANLRRMAELEAAATGRRQFMQKFWGVALAILLGSAAFLLFVIFLVVCLGVRLS